MNQDKITTEKFTGGLNVYSNDGHICCITRLCKEKPAVQIDLNTDCRIARPGVFDELADKEFSNLDNALAAVRFAFYSVSNAEILRAAISMPDKVVLPCKNSPPPRRPYAYLASVLIAGHAFTITESGLLSAAARLSDAMYEKLDSIDPDGLFFTYDEDDEKAIFPSRRAAMQRYENNLGMRRGYEKLPPADKIFINRVQDNPFCGGLAGLIAYACAVTEWHERGYIDKRVYTAALRTVGYAF